MPPSETAHGRGGLRSLVEHFDSGIHGPLLLVPGRPGDTDSLVPGMGEDFVRRVYDRGGNVSEHTGYPVGRIAMTPAVMDAAILTAQLISHPDARGGFHLEPTSSGEAALSLAVIDFDKITEESLVHVVSRNGWTSMPPNFPQSEKDPRLVLNEPAVYERTLRDNDGHAIYVPILGSATVSLSDIEFPIQPRLSLGDLVTPHTLTMGK